MANTPEDLYPRLPPPSRWQVSRRWQVSLLSLFLLQFAAAIFLALHVGGFQVQFLFDLPPAVLVFTPVLATAMIATIFLGVRPLIGAVVCLIALLVASVILLVVIVEYPEVPQHLAGIRTTSEPLGDDPSELPAARKKVPRMLPEFDSYLCLSWGVGMCLAIGSALGCALSAVKSGEF